MTPNILAEKVFELTKEEQELVDFCMSCDCPYYIQEDYAGENTSRQFFGHILMARSPNNDTETGVINSKLYDDFLNLFNRFCEENNIKPTKILRAALNSTGYSSKKHGGIHIDHEGFQHYNFIMYMNDVGGGTYLFNDKNEIVYDVKQQKNKVVVFEGMPHAQGFCDDGKFRFVLVFTFLI